MSINILKVVKIYIKKKSENQQTNFATSEIVKPKYILAGKTVRVKKVIKICCYSL